MTRDHEALATRLLAPMRPQLEAARAATAGAAAGTDVWERCIAGGLVSADWPGDSRVAGRMCNGCYGRGEVEGSDGNGASTGMWGCPQCSQDLERVWTHELVTAIVADPDGVVAVEALMREAANRLSYVPDIRAGTFSWSVVTRGARFYKRQYAHREYYWHLFGTGREHWFGPIPELWPLARMQRQPPAAIEQVLDAFDRTARPRDNTMAHLAGIDLAAELCWNELAAQSLPFYVNQPNPFTPIVDIWARGYIPAGWDAGKLYLAAPEAVWCSIGDCTVCGAWPDKLRRDTSGVERLVLAGNPEFRRCPDCGTYYELDVEDLTRLTPSEALSRLPHDERAVLAGRWTTLMSQLQTCFYCHESEVLRAYARRAGADKR